METKDQKSTGSDTNGQGVSKPSEGTTQGGTPQGGGGGHHSGKSGGHGSSPSGNKQRDK